MVPEGCVFYLKSFENNPHYHIIIFTDPLGRDKRCIACYITSTETLPDHTTTFEAGDDFFITKKSWVKYRNARILLEMDLQKFEKLGEIKTNNLRKIQDGFEQSLKKVPREVKELWEQWKQDSLFS